MSERIGPTREWVPMTAYDQEALSRRFWGLVTLHSGWWQPMLKAGPLLKSN